MTTSKQLIAMIQSHAAGDNQQPLAHFRQFAFWNAGYPFEMLRMGERHKLEQVFLTDRVKRIDTAVKRPGIGQVQSHIIVSLMKSCNAAFCAICDKSE